MYEARKRSSGNVIILVFRQKLRRQGKILSPASHLESLGKDPTLLRGRTVQGPRRKGPCDNPAAVPDCRTCRYLLLETSRAHRDLVQSFIRRFLFQSQSMRTQTRTVTFSVSPIIYCALFKHTGMHQLKTSTLFIPSFSLH